MLSIVEMFLLFFFNEAAVYDASLQPDCVFMSYHGNMHVWFHSYACLTLWPQSFNPRKIQYQKYNFLAEKLYGYFSGTFSNLFDFINVVKCTGKSLYAFLEIWQFHCSLFCFYNKQDLYSITYRKWQSIMHWNH